MSRPTIVLSLVTLLALGGCNTPSDVTSSAPTSASDATTESPVERETAGVANNSAAVPDKVSQPSETVNAPANSGSNTTASNTAPKPSNTANTPSANGAVEQKPEAPTTAAPTTVETEAPSSSDPGTSPSSATASNGADAGVTVLSASSLDTSIVPGQQFSMVTPSTSYDDLAKAVGDDRLTTSEVHLGEGIMSPATQVTLDDGYSFSVVWKDGDRTQPTEIRDLGAAWKPQGIYKGMSFDELQAALGSFDLFGFGWDYGGTILLENTPLEPYSGKMFIRVQPSVKAIETQNDKFIAVSGDRLFESSDPNFSDLDVSVVEIVVRLE